MVLSSLERPSLWDLPRISQVITKDLERIDSIRQASDHSWIVKKQENRRNRALDEIKILENKIAPEGIQKSIQENSHHLSFPHLSLPSGHFI